MCSYQKTTNSGYSVLHYYLILLILVCRDKTVNTKPTSSKHDMQLTIDYLGACHLSTDINAWVCEHTASKANSTGAFIRWSTLCMPDQKCYWINLGKFCTVLPELGPLRHSMEGPVSGSTRPMGLRRKLLWSQYHSCTSQQSSLAW